MATYLEKIESAQNGINSFYKLLNIYKLSRMNNGWIGTETNPTDITLSKFDTYFTDNNLTKSSSDVTASLFDIPMSSRGYDRNGNYGSGIPSDIGFTFNVEQDSNGKYLLHSPLYKVSDSDTAAGRASYVATNTIGGTVEYSIVSDGVEINPNGSTEALISKISSNWSMGTSYIITTADNANHMNMLYCFISINKASYGAVLHVTPNFITWNSHQIIPSAVSDIEWSDLTGGISNIPTRSADNALLVQSFIEKYFRILPNNNYLIMYPSELYNGTNKTTMVKMYSPWSREALLSIKDPYDTTEDFQDKAINGFSSFMTENGEAVLYYNNRAETPMCLYNGRTMGTFTGVVSDNYKSEIIESPKIAKIYDIPTENNTTPFEVSIDGIVMDCAVNTLESKNGKLTLDDIPAAYINLAIGDIGKPYQNNSADQISLYLDSTIDMMDNIDVDFSNYVISKSVDGNAYLEDTDLHGVKWREGPFAGYRDWVSVCYGSGKYVAISGRSNIFAYSTDGITWKEVTVSSTNRQWEYVCYGNGKFVAIAFNSDIFAYSTDGITWSESTISATSRQWQHVCYGKDKFVAIVFNSNVFAYSSDGITWTELNVNTRQWQAVCYGNGKFVAIVYNSNVCAYSTDGITWQESSLSNGTVRNWVSVCYGKDKYVAVAYKSNEVAYSSDGVTWTIGTISSTSRDWLSVCYGNGKYMAIAANTTIFAYSLDGITWTEDDANTTSTAWSCLEYCNDRFIALLHYEEIFAYTYTNVPLAGMYISENNKLSIIDKPDVYRSNVRYRASIFGNTENPNMTKVTNNPSLVDGKY